MYFANFRTTDISESTTHAQVKRWAMKFSAPKSDLLYGNTMKDFMENVENSGTQEVYFHDLDFSGAFIVQWLMKNDYAPIDILNKDEDGKNIPLSPLEWRYVCNEKNGIYLISVMFKNGNEVSFIDTWKTLTSSYEDLKEAAGIKEEFGIDLFNDFTKEKQDRIQLREMEEEIDAVIYSYKKALTKHKKRLTRSAMSFEEFKDFYNKEHKSQRAFSIDFGGKLYEYSSNSFKPYNVLSLKEWKRVHMSFGGGYNAWKEGIEDKLLKVPNGYIYDANAMHTSIALENSVPYGKMLNSKPLSGTYATLLTINIKSAVKKDKRTPNLIRVKNNRYQAATYTSHIENEERVYWKEEWDFISKHYFIDGFILKENYFRTAPKLKSFLESRVELRHNYGDPVEKDLDKGSRNGFIGKMAQSATMGSKVIYKDGFQVSNIVNDTSFKNINGEIEFVKAGDRVLVDSMTGELFKKISQRYKRYGKYGEYAHKIRFLESEQRNHIATAAYVYMLARVKLWNVIFPNLDIWLYSDSDSAFFTNIPKGIKVHSTKFGFWKPQNKFDYFKVLRGKAYMIRSTAYWKNGKWIEKKETIAKVSGLNPEGKASLTFENFHEGHIVKNGKNAMLEVEGGKIKYKVDFQLGGREW